MLGSFSLLLAWTVKFAHDPYERTLASARISLVEL